TRRIRVNTTARLKTWVLALGLFVAASLFPARAAAQNTTDLSVRMFLTTETLSRKVPEGVRANGGDPLTYSIVIKNNGPNTATNVRLVVALPEGMLVDSSNAQAFGFNCLPIGNVNPMYQCALSSLSSSGGDPCDREEHLRQVRQASTKTLPVSNSMS